VASNTTSENFTSSSSRNFFGNRVSSNEVRDREESSESQRQSNINQRVPESPDREALKDAIKNFINAKNWHPLLSSVVTLIVSPIVDWIWPMIYSVSPLLLSFLNQNG